MGIYKKGILGAFSGKIGAVVGSNWKGIEYMRSLPRPSKKAPSELQLKQRGKVSLAAKFLKPISSLVNLGYQDLAIRKTGYNVATAHIIADTITGAYPDFEIDYTKVLFSQGSLTGPWNVSCTSAISGLDVSWTDNSGAGTAKETDKVVLLAYNTVKSESVYIAETGVERNATTEHVVLPSNFSGDTVHVWVAFISSDMKVISTSIYAGSVVIA